MTALYLQEALMAEVKEILKDIITENESGGRVSGVNVFKQQLPVFRGNEREASKTLDGNTKVDDPWTVTAGIYLGVRDSDRENQGHRHVMVMIQRIVDRFVSEPLLDNKYWAQQDMEWALDTENLHPNFYGAVCIRFSVPKIGRRMTEYD